jgi:hypothetical protein
MNVNKWHILAALLLVMGTWYFSKGPIRSGADGVNYVDSLVVVYDTLPYYDTTRPNLVGVEPMQLPMVIDTAAVLKEFFSRKTYQDSLQVNDVSIKVNYSLLGNSLEGTRWEVVNLRPTAISYHPATLKKNDIGAGLLMGVNLAAPTLSYQYKKLQLQLGYNFIQVEGSPAWVIGLHYSLLKW